MRRACRTDRVNMWYNCNYLVERNSGALCFSKTANIPQTYFVGKVPSMCGLTSLAVRLGIGSAHGGHFAMETRVCKLCGVEQSFSEFCTKKSYPTNRICRNCRNAQSAERRSSNRDKYSSQRRRHYAENRTSELDRARDYRRSHPVEVKNSQQKYKEAHREYLRIMDRERRKNNQEKYRAACREYYRRHKQYFSEKEKAFIRKNPLYHISHRRKNIEIYREYINRRRARIKGSVVERIDRSAIYKRDSGRCHICGAKVSRKVWHLDHLIPVSLGGPHVASNVAVACPGCNQKRSNTGPAQLRLFGEI